ncbi:MAG: ABC transporter ATP-binding protein [Eubacteriales bacterium]|jgi:ABC-2 type transport system ATP-binding protein
MAEIECRDLVKRYGRKTALNGINLSLEKQRIIGLAGPNGSGKTTLIKLIQRLLTPTSGSIEIEGMKPGKETKALISYLPDRDFLPDWMKADGLMNFYESFFEDFDREKAEKLLDELKIDRSLTLKKMSKGTREKVQLVLCMSRKAEVYLLDEPLAGVDPAARDFIIHTILDNYNEDGMVLISTHLISDIESILDEVVFLKDGQIFLHENADDLRARTGKSIDDYFREVFAC